MLPVWTRVTVKPYTFHYVIVDQICTMTMTERNYPRQLAFKYLREVHDRFIKQMKEDFGNEYVGPLKPVDAEGGGAQLLHSWPAYLFLTHFTPGVSFFFFFLNLLALPAVTRSRLRRLLGRMNLLILTGK